MDPRGPTPGILGEDLSFSPHFKKWQMTPPPSSRPGYAPASFRLFISTQHVVYQYCLCML